MGCSKLSRRQTITPRGVIVRTVERRNERCRAANDCTRAVIVRSYRTEPVELNVKLEKKIKNKKKIRLTKTENNEKQTKIKD
jgi:hypothetical protein